MGAESLRWRVSTASPGVEGPAEVTSTDQWRVIVTRPGVKGDGVSYQGEDEQIARDVFKRDAGHYSESEPSATVELQSRTVGPWLMEDVNDAH